jgi:prevent-host-death family protein
VYYANVRALKVETAKVLTLSRKKGPVIITRKGQPIAVLRYLDPDKAWKEFDTLWVRLRQAARKAGYGRRDVERLIAEVRKTK